METNNKKSKKIKKNPNQNVRKTKNKQADLIEDLKMEIATELGIIEQINNKGWNSLSPRVSGKIGGKIAQRLKGFDK
ncbi:MAG: spore protein [Gracilibacter sp. BRH_c7a]|nr:MAG: spore protein [Gracilibacter sp. BRH_c7a]